MFVESLQMLRRWLCVATVVAGLILPAVVGCLMPSAARAQTMECCAQLSCTQGHQKQTCFSTTAPTGSLQTAPQARVSLEMPALVTGAAAPVPPRDVAAGGSTEAAEASQHSPPELYTLHLALLI